jgi:hypothetical protein
MNEVLVLLAPKVADDDYVPFMSNQLGFSLTDLHNTGIWEC